MEEVKQQQAKQKEKKPPKPQAVPQKAKKIIKFALMSPYLTYYEVMPAKPSKDFVSYTLIDTLKALHKNLAEQSQVETVNEPPSKRFKSNNQISLSQIKLLSKHKQIFIGLNKVQSQLIQSSEDPQAKEQLLVFILNDIETSEICKHIVGFCRQFAFHSYLFPKFLKKNCSELMGTQKLTCFAIKIEDNKIRKTVMEELREFDNHPDNGSELKDFKYAEEVLFKTCSIKKWQVDINPKKVK